MKKFFSILMAAVLLCLSACGGKPAASSGNPELEKSQPSVSQSQPEDGSIEEWRAEQKIVADGEAVVVEEGGTYNSLER